MDLGIVCGLLFFENVNDFVAADPSNLKSGIMDGAEPGHGYAWCLPSIFLGGDDAGVLVAGVGCKSAIFSNECMPYISLRKSIF
jgi:hypothetical protein